MWRGGGGGTFGSTSKMPVNTGCQLKMEGKTKERKKDVSMAGVVITGGGVRGVEGLGAVEETCQRTA